MAVLTGLTSKWIPDEGLGNDVRCAVFAAGMTAVPRIRVNVGWVECVTVPLSGSTCRHHRDTVHAATSS